MSKENPEIINVIAHELKTPIGAMKGFLQLVERGGELSELQERFLTRAYMSLSKMEQLVTDLLDYARLESGAPLNLEYLQLEVVLQKVSFELLNQDFTPHALQIHLPSNSVGINVDGRLIRLVLHNLMSNAMKYGRKGGSIWVNITETDTEIQVDVVDDGIGIPEESLPHVFDRFYRVSDKEGGIKGTGLGLAICKMIIERHNGRIWATSEFGKGSQFSFVLPR